MVFNQTGDWQFLDNEDGTLSLYDQSTGLPIMTMDEAGDVIIEDGPLDLDPSSSGLADGSSIDSNEAKFIGYYDSDGTSGVTATAVESTVQHVVSSDGTSVVDFRIGGSDLFRINSNGNIEAVSGDIIVSGSVDGVDLSAHASNASAHHAKYTDSEAVSAVESEDPLDLAGDLNAADGETIWSESNTWIPQPRLENDSVTVAGNSVSLGGSTAIAHGDLSDAPAEAHHAQIQFSNSGTSVLTQPSDVDFTSNISVSDDGDGTVTISATDTDTSDHGSLSGLSDDDHTQYLLADGSRNMTGSLRINHNGDSPLTIQNTENTGTSGTADGGWNYIQFYDGDGDRQGYFGIDPNGNFQFQPEVSGAVVEWGSDTVATRPWAQGGNIDHSQLGTTNSDDHHAKYTDSEARSAVEGTTDVADLVGSLGTAGQVPQTDGTAVSWVTLPHDDLTSIGASDHHTKYTDEEAQDAVGNNFDASLSYDDATPSFGVATNGIGTDELDLSITPTWTSQHTFNSGIDITGSVVVLDSTLQLSSASAGGDAGWAFVDSDLPTTNFIDYDKGSSTLYFGRGSGVSTVFNTENVSYTQGSEITVDSGAVNLHSGTTFPRGELPDGFGMEQGDESKSHGVPLGWDYHRDNSFDEGLGFLQKVPSDSEFDSRLSWGTDDTYQDANGNPVDWYYLSKTFKVNAGSMDLSLSAQVSINADVPSSITYTEGSETFLAEDDAYWEVHCYDSSGASISLSTANQYSESVSHQEYERNGGFSTNWGWFPLSHSFTVPSNTAYIEVRLVSSEGNNSVHPLGTKQANSGTKFDDIEIHYQGSLVQVPPTYTSHLNTSDAHHTKYTDEEAQDAVGNNFDASLSYDDATPSFGVATDGIGTNELDLSIAPTWTSQHQFDNGIDSRGDIVDDTTVIWDTSAGEIPDAAMGSIANSTLTNSSISLTGGNAIDAIGSISLGGSATVAVSSGGIQTDELDLSIAPTWTGTHTFNSGVDLASSAITGVNNIFSEAGSDLEIYSNATASDSTERNIDFYILDSDGLGFERGAALEVNAGTVLGHAFITPHSNFVAPTVAYFGGDPNVVSTSTEGDVRMPNNTDLYARNDGDTGNFGINFGDSSATDRIIVDGVPLEVNDDIQDDASNTIYDKSNTHVPRSILEGDTNALDGSQGTDGQVWTSTGTSAQWEDASGGSGTPSGTIAYHVNDGSSLPSGWVLCDGNNGTPDLRGQYIKGASGTGDEGTTGGANTVSLSQSELDSHHHDLRTDSDTGENDEAMIDSEAPRFTFLIGELDSVKTSTVGGDSAHQNEPSFTELRPMMKT